MKRSLLFIVFLLQFISAVNAQTIIGRQNVDQYPTASWGDKTYGLTWLPEDYNSTSDSYPLIIFLHGAGETGDGISGLNNLLNAGLPKKIAEGWDPEAVNPADGKNYQFIVVSPQAPTSSYWSYSYTHVSYILPDVIKRYRVDTSRIYIIGISAGGAGTWSCVTNDSNFTKKIAAVLPVSAAGVNNPFVEYPNIQYISGKYGVKVWTVCGTVDAFYSAIAIPYVNMINKGTPAPAVPAKVTGVPGYGHDNNLWDKVFDASWRSNALNLNFYEWMLQYKRDVSGSKNNKAPIANAGTNKSITLPVNSTTLSGSGSDADGTITAYLWSKVSGPSQFTIASPASPQTNITNLVAGIYKFELKVTDNASATGRDTVTVNVLSTSNNSPVANAGADQTITLPSNSVALTGSGTDADGSITSYEWSKISGPSQYTIGNSSSAITTVTNLVAGIYIFRLTVTDNNGAASTDDINISVNAALPGYKTITEKIEAESYDAMNGIKTEPTADAGEGLDVGWIDNNDWMDYNIYVDSSGTYTVNFRIAAPASNGKLQLTKPDGTVLATIDIPNTASYQGWCTRSAVVNLTQGYQTIRVISTTSVGWNFNWMQFVRGTSTGTPIPARIQAEDYTQMLGIQMEPTGDTGGGLNVGWLNDGDWLDYNVNAATAGEYTVNLRLSTPNAAAKLQIMDADGTVLSRVNIPRTGGYQIWSTVSTTIAIPAGQQTLRIISTSMQDWNINWLEFIQPNDLIAQGGNNSLQVNEALKLQQPAAAFSIFPNPVKDKFILKVDNDITGIVNVQINSMQGAMMKTFKLNKNIKGAQEFNVSAYGLAQGAYVIRLQSGNQVDSKIIIKQ